MRLTQSSCRLGLLTAALLAFGCTPASPKSGGRLAQWEIVPSLSIGGAEEGPTAFTDIRGLEVDDQGRILVLDYATQQIEMFDSTGTHLRTIGRRGMGPGELNDANGLLRDPEGNFWVNDPNSNRFTVFDPEGELLHTLPMSITGYGYIWEGWFDRDSTLYEPVDVRVDTTWTTHLRRVRARGRLIDTLPGGLPCDGMLPRPTSANMFVYTFPRGNGVMGIPFAPEPLRVFDRRGHAWCGTSDVYTLRRVGFVPGDTVTLTGQRTALPVPVAEREARIDAIRKQLEKLGATEPDWSRIPTIQPILTRVLVDDSGRVWINTPSAEPGALWDVFDSDGTPLATVHSSAEFGQYHPVRFHGDNVYAVVRDSNDVPFVFRGRIRRGT